MSAPVAISVLLGLIGVPLGLLVAGRGVRFFGPRRRGAFRGAVIGYAGACAITLLLLGAPPFVWPPPSTGVRIWLAVGLLAGPALGAALGGVVASRKG